MRNKQTWFNASLLLEFCALPNTVGKFESSRRGDF